MENKSYGKLPQIHQISSWPISCIQLGNNDGKPRRPSERPQQANRSIVSSFGVILEPALLMHLDTLFFEPNFLQLQKDGDQ